MVNLPMFPQLHRDKAPRSALLRGRCVAGLLSELRGGEGRHASDMGCVEGPGRNVGNLMGKPRLKPGEVW